MLRFFTIGLLLSVPVFGSYYRADRTFNEYVEFAQKKINGAVFVTRDARTTSNGIYKCSGTLINPWTVLIAGHCVVNRTGQEISPFNMSAGYGDIPVNDPITKYKSKRISLNGAYNKGSKDAYDIALIHLETPIYTPNNLYGELSSNAPHIGDAVVGYGYGNVAKNDGTDPITNNNQLLAYETIVSRVYTDSPYYGTQLQLKPNWTTQNYAGTSAEGDSGGGIINAEGKIIGVTSSGDAERLIPRFMNVVNTTAPSIRTFLTKFNTEWKHITWSGSASNLPRNTTENGRDIQYDITPINDATKVVIDEDIHVDRFVLNNENASFVVNKDVTATLDYGLDLNKGTSTVNGILKMNSLRVAPGTIHSSPTGIMLVGEGTIILEGGKVETPTLSMQGGYVEGNGTISGTLTQTGGYISPSNGDLPGVITINGPYQSTQNARINIRLFRNGISDRLVLQSMLPSNLRMNFIFPNNFVDYGKAYTVLTSGNGINITDVTTNGYTITTLYRFISSSQTDKYQIIQDFMFDNNKIVVIPRSFEPLAQTADHITYVHQALNEAYNSRSTIMHPLFEKAQSMPPTVFAKALKAFSDPTLHKNIQKAFSNTFAQSTHQGERIELFLENKRQALDLKSFSFIGIEGFSGEDLFNSVPKNTSFSLFISGDLYDNTTNYVTKGLTFGADYATEKTLTGLRFHFKNQLDLQKEYHFDIYHAKKENFYFYDVSFGQVQYAHDVSHSNIWGKWDAHVDAHKTHLDSRFGAYNINKTFFNLGYIGLSGAFSKVNPFSTMIETLKMNTSESSLLSLDAKIGLESKVRLHLDEIIVEPSIHAAFSYPLFEVFHASSNTFEVAPQSSFRHETFSLDKTSLFLGLALRIYIPGNTIIKAEIENSKQCEEIYLKTFLNINIQL